MSEKKAKLKRKTALFKRKQLFKPLTVEIHGEEIYIPRRERRKIMRKFKTDLKKGRIDLAKLNQERIKRNNDRQEQGHGV